MSVYVEKRPYRVRRDYLIRAVQRRRKKIREMALAYKGGKCERCGYDRCSEALEFHHLSSDDKDFGISANGHSRSWERTKKELDKCILLCANCHREIHSKSAIEAAAF
jgi:5-methylcytosine-specific restriction endonuclease McrA